MKTSTTRASRALAASVTPRSVVTLTTQVSGRRRTTRSGPLASKGQGRWVSSTRAASDKDEAKTESRNPLLEAFEQYKAEGKLDNNGAKTQTKPKKAEEEGSKSKNGSGGPTFTLPGVPKNVEAYTEWRATFKALTDFGLQSRSASEAARLVREGKAVLVDVRTAKLYGREHMEPSVSLPLYVKEKGGEGNLAKKVFLGSNTTRKNESFAEDAKSLLPSSADKEIIVACSVGGTLKTEFERDYKDKPSYVDSQRAFGRDSLSLRAAAALLDAGFTNIAHLEGGMSSWRAAELPLAGTMVRKDSASKVEEVKPVTEKKEKIFGIAMSDKAYAVWPVVHAFLTEKGLKSISGSDALEKIEAGDAIVIDVSLKKAYARSHIEPSYNVPLYRNMTGNKSLGNIKNFFTGYFDSAKERDPNFVSEVTKSLAGDDEGADTTTKTIIVTCSRGGTLKTESFDKYGNPYYDPQFKFGIESNSLNAAYELIEAGYKDVLHLEGGNSAWSFAKLPMFRKRGKSGEAFPQKDTSNRTVVPKPKPAVNPNSMKARGGDKIADKNKETDEKKEKAAAAVSSDEMNNNNNKQQEED